MGKRYCRVEAAELNGFRIDDRADAVECSTPGKHQ